jgi:hypothetical protein
MAVEVKARADSLELSAPKTLFELAAGNLNAPLTPRPQNERTAFRGISKSSTCTALPGCYPRAIGVPASQP